MGRPIRAPDSKRIYASLEKKMKKNVCVLVADGSEEMEVVITVDVLRRAGIGVFLAGVGESRLLTASRGVRLAPDGAWDFTESRRFDALVIPGGIGGSQILRQEESVKQVVREFAEAGKILAAICAGPTVLQEAGVLSGRTYTSYPGCRVGALITSQAPGTAFAFGLALIEALDSAETADQVAEGMRVKR